MTRRPSGFVSLVLLVAACALLGVALPNVGNVLRAATADGVPGTFTARQLSCVRHPGHETCEWVGSFRSADGTSALESVRMYGRGRDSLAEGQRVAAVDVGLPGRVYGPGGSREWIFTGLLLLAGYALFALVAKRHLMPPPARPSTTTAASRPLPEGDAPREETLAGAEPHRLP
ncbi:hypothetical protein [Streptomyces sp. TSRI0107]|uniref:hypothetical protein n=1 Tax=Streptomyces sp. TSRI0107 TaxID=1703942 RepID=UPI000A9FDF81|nr:hypothetical protein [Streptomyces sp. TSRI0107]